MAKHVREIGPGGVEGYLRERVTATGGMCEKHVSPGRKGVPDDLVTWPGGVMDLVETKAPDGALSGAQTRDHDRRRGYGVEVIVLWTKAHVDAYVAWRSRRGS